MQVSILTSPYPVQAMSLKDDDLLVVSLPADTDPELAQEILTRIVHSIRNVDQIKVHVVAAIGAFTIEHLNEKQMKKYGWVKADGAS